VTRVVTFAKTTPDGKMFTCFLLVLLTGVSFSAAKIIAYI